MAASVIDEILYRAQNLTDKELERLQSEITSLAQARASASHTSSAPEPASGITAPRRSLLGLVADRGPAPTPEEIDDARRDMWADFPRDDV